MFADDFHKPKKYLSVNEAKLKAADYCAYQERSQQEVRNKLYSYGLHQDEVEQVISELITEKFINEERFARAYVGGKFRMKKWGRIKIIQGLKQHKISEYCIKKGLSEIDEDDYNETIQALIDKKKAYITGGSPQLIKKKLAAFLQQKGYESNLVWESLNS
jgi:regulatory protein